MKRTTICFILALLLNFVAAAENLDKQRIELKPRSFHKNIERDESKKVNPRSFYYNKHTKVENTPHVDLLYIEPEKKIDLKGDGNKTMKQRPQNNGVKEKEMYKLHYHRLINMLLKNIYIENDESGFIEGTIGIQASLEEWEILQNVESQSVPLKEVDEILSRVLHQPGQSLYAKTMISLSFVSHFVYKHEYKFYVLVAFITAGFVMMKFCTSRSTTVTFITICIICTSWYITHNDMIKEVMIKQKTDEMLYKEMPASCMPQTMKPWYEKVWPLNAVFSQSNIDDCQKYVEVNLFTPLTEVTLLMSFSRMISRFVFEPVSEYGNTLNVFLKNLTSGMSTFKKSIVEMIVYFCHIVIIFLILVISFGSFSIFTPFGLIKLEGKPAVAPERIETFERIPTSRARPKVTCRVTKEKRKEEILVALNYNSASDDESSVRVEHSSKTKKAVKQHSTVKNDMSSKEEEDENETDSDSYEAGPSNAKKRNSPDECKKIGFKTISLNNSNDQVTSENANNDIID